MLEVTSLYAYAQLQDLANLELGIPYWLVTKESKAAFKAFKFASLGLLSPTYL